MKLCPQCEFIYEDEQSYCDMDGTGLVSNPAAELVRSRLTIPLVADSAPKTRRSGSIVLAALVLVVLAGLVIAAYFARTPQTLAVRNSEREQPPQQATQQSTHSATRLTDQPSADQLSVEQTSISPAEEQPTPTTASALDQPEVDTAPSGMSSAEMSPADSLISAGPVAASPGTTKKRGSVIVRFTNGAAIKADDAWEKPGGVWYRQAGMVTFVKRNRVRSIERVASSPRSQTGNGAPNSHTQGAKKSGTREPVRVAKGEPVKPKKESRVTSFLKKTGNFFKRPFRF